MNGLLDNWGVFYRGLVLGLMVAAPVGPVGLLCIRRTIQKGAWHGFATGFGAAFADAFFSAVAAFGITAVMDIMRNYNNPLYVLSGALLLFISWHAWHDKPRQPELEKAGERYLRRFKFHLGSAAQAMATSFLITISNPGTIFGVVAVVATFGGLHSSEDAATIIAGIFVGSSLWWLMLSGSVSLLRKKFTESRIVTLNRATALILGGIALWVFAIGLKGLLKI